MSSTYVSAFSAGLISFISPCIIPMITVYFTLITGLSLEDIKNIKESKGKYANVIINTLLFIFAFTLVFTIAGGLSGKVANFVSDQTMLFNVIGGVMIIILALKQLGILKKLSGGNLKIEKFINISSKNKYTRYATTFLIGVFFAIACSHCIGPILYSMLIIAGSSGSFYTGMKVMFVFSIGLAIPYLFLGIAFNRSLKVIKRLQKYHKLISYISGAILLFLGIILLFNKFTLMVEFLYRILPFQSPIGM